MVKEAIVLGHKISKKGIKVDKAKVDLITKPLHPTIVKGIRCFLDHASFYQQFIQDFSKIARPMTCLLEKDTPFFFSKECIESFQTLMRKLTEAPILVTPDWDLPFKLMCDASDFDIGAVLGQRKTKHFQLIHYASKTMTDAQAHYTTTEKELLAVVKPLTFSRLATMDPSGDIMARTTPPKRHRFHGAILVFMREQIYTRGHQLLVEMGRSKSARHQRRPSYLQIFEISLCRFGTPRAIISDRGTHFCNDQFTKVMLKYGVTHHLAIAYHPQTSGQVEVSNRGLKRILERTVGKNRASLSDKLDDDLWAFRTTFKTPIGCTPYKLVYEKACHLPIELKHKAYWDLKHADFDLQTTGDHLKVPLNELTELRDQASKKSLIYKEKTKRIHDSKIKDRVFNIGLSWILKTCARGFVLRSLNLQILSFILKIRYPNLID
nr:reverse transcriptase domain-containing protein [Tanacetum cinerariifolium]